MKPTKRTTLDIPVCHEVQIHYKRPLYDTAKRISSSQEVETILRDFADIERIDYKEFFWVILLTNANQVIAISEIGVGTTTSVLVNTKEILQLALLAHATGIIIAHNHSSGKTAPSDRDHNITKCLKKSAKLLDITLLDHLILTTESYASFADEGWL